MSNGVAPEYSACADHKNTIGINLQHKFENRSDEQVFRRFFVIFWVLSVYDDVSSDKRFLMICRWHEK
jgi:hypothetical protein